MCFVRSASVNESLLLLCSGSNGLTVYRTRPGQRAFETVLRVGTMTRFLSFLLFLFITRNSS